MSQTRLIVCADDYGLTPGICEGILRCHADGMVTSTSVLAIGPAFAENAARLRDSGLEAGVHLAVVGEDPPLLSAREIPSIVDRRGLLPRNWRALLGRLVMRAVDPEDVAKEFAAQFRAVRESGLDPVHVNTHQHVHLWPDLANLVIDLARREEVRSIRVPGSGLRTPRGRGVDALGGRLRRKAEEAGLATTDWFAGLDEAGHMSASSLHRALRAAAAARPTYAELVVHPGLQEDPDRARYRWGYEWHREESALRRVDVLNHAEALGLELCTFADHARSTRSNRSHAD